MDSTLETLTTTRTKPTNASHATLSIRPRTLAPWNTFGYAALPVGVAVAPAAGAGVEAGIRSTGMRDFVALQGAAPPRENPR